VSDSTETTRIAALKTALESSQKREDEFAAIARELLKRNQALLSKVQSLEQRIQELEKPIGNGNEDWISRIMITINRCGRPMRLRELKEQLQVAGNAQGLKSLDKSLSVTLTRAVDRGRLKPFKVPGCRGDFYALAKWVDKNGDLPQEMWDQMY